MEECIESTARMSCEGSTKQRRGRDDKICAVCGDKALGYNFDAISCESCKAFFRRNAPKGSEYFRCAYEEKCSIDYKNRRFCKSCRLKKCFIVGMRREYILSDEEKAMKRQKIQENRSRKKAATALDDYPTSPPNIFHHSLSDMMPQPVYIASIPVVLSPPQPLLQPQEAPVTYSTSTDSSDSPRSVAPLTFEDTAAIDELLYAYRKSLEINTDFDVPRHSANFSDLVNIAELSVRRVIAMAKLVASFRDLPHFDQIQLLKGGSIELLILRSVLTFDKDKQQFLDPYDAEESKALKTEQLEAAESGTGLFEHHMKFVRSLVFDLRADEVTLILLLVVSLFSPDRENVTHKDLIAAEQERYAGILERYLVATLPSDAAATVFPKLLMKLADIRNLNEQHSQVLLRVNPEGIQPLMKEVLDLSY